MRRRRAVVFAGMLLVVLLGIPSAATTRAAPIGKPAARTITTVAGNGDQGSTGDGRAATKAAVEYPQAVATGPDGTLYILARLRVRAVDPETGTITTIAGTGKAGFSGDGGPATKATFSTRSNGTLYGARGLGVGPDGTVYVADTGNHRIRAIDPDTGRIDTVAGSGKPGGEGGAFAGDGGPATEARLYYPKDVVVGDDGTLYIADHLNYRIRAVDRDTGRIDTVAGTKNPGDDGVGFFPKPSGKDSGGRATKTFVEPENLAVGRDGIVYFSDTDDDQVFAVDPEKDKIRVVAGRDSPSEDSLHSPTGLVVGAHGVLYIATNDQFAVAPEKNRVYALDLKKRRLKPFTGGATDKSGLGDGGSPREAYLAGPGPSGSMGIAYAHGTVYIADAQSNRVRAVGRGLAGKAPRETLAGKTIETLAGSGKELGEKQKQKQHDDEDSPFYRDVHDLDEVDLDDPAGVAVGRDGTVYIADTGNDRVRAIDPGDDSVHTVAGTTEHPDPGDVRGDDATDTYLESPRGLAVGPGHTLYATAEDADGVHRRVWAVDLEDGTIDIAQGTEAVHHPVDVDVAGDGTVYVADNYAGVCKVAAGSDRCKTVVDRMIDSETGWAFNSLTAVAVGADDTLYIADSVAGRVRAVDTKTGTVATVAGAYPPGPGFSGDGGPATSAQLHAPVDLDVSAGGTLYIADEGNHRIRAVDPETGTITTVAGIGRYEKGDEVGEAGGGGFGGDGGPVRRAELDQPQDVALGPDGALYVADTGNNRIRVIGGDGSARGSNNTGWLLVGMLLGAALVVVLYIRRRRARRVATQGAGGEPS